MPAEKYVTEFVKEAGFTPIPDRAIIVTYAPANMSGGSPNSFPMSFLLCKCARTLWYCFPSDGCPSC